MEENKLYFIKEEYFDKFKTKFTSKNKQTDITEHNRPCYYAFKENYIYWMIPISSQVEKYEVEYEKSIKKYNMCDSISFGYIKGNKNAFLIQNMIPVTEKYFSLIYTHANSDKPIEINEKKAKEINAKARKILRFSRNGKKMTFTPILEFEKMLLDELKSK